MKYSEHSGSTGRKKEAALAALAALCLGPAWGADTNTDTHGSALTDRTIGYVLTDMKWAVYESPRGKTECPNGLNTLGPREQFEVLYPENKKRTLVDTALRFEENTWYPTTTPDRFPFHEAQGPSFGLNLDGKVGANDFKHPDGTPGIDNQLYRAIGCVIGFRVDGLQYIFQRLVVKKARYVRTIIEVSEVDDLANDPEVLVTIYRGMDRLLTDATGDKIMPGGTQRIDTRWGAGFIQQVPGKIVEGVLTTEPTTRMVLPWNSDTGVPTAQIIRDMRLQLNISPTAADGLIAGYADVEAFYTSLIRADSTHHLSNGQISAPSLYKKLRRVADAYPNATGENTAISSAINATFTQVYIRHPEGAAAKAQLLRSLAERSGSLAKANPRQTDTAQQTH